MYNLTMAYAYWKLGLHDTEAVYHMYIRKNPFEGGFTIFAGLETVVQFFTTFFNLMPDEMEYLSNLKDINGNKIFTDEFLNYLYKMRFSCNIYAVPEGTIVFPNEPIIRVSGPIIQCQLIETMLLNAIGFQTLIATKAARICMAALGAPITEFGMRRAP